MFGLYERNRKYHFGFFVGIVCSWLFTLWYNAWGGEFVALLICFVIVTAIIAAGDKFTQNITDDKEDSDG